MSEQKTYSSVTDLMRETFDDKEFCDDVAERIESRRFIMQLIAARTARNVSQSDVARILGVTQSRVSKLESGVDNDLQIGHLKAYAEALGLQSEIALVPAGTTQVDRAHFHAAKMQESLDKLSELAGSDKEMIGGISAAIGKMFLGVISTFTKCSETLHENDELVETRDRFRVTIEPVEGVENRDGKAGIVDSGSTNAHDATEETYLA